MRKPIINKEFKEKLAEAQIVCQRFEKELKPMQEAEQKRLKEAYEGKLAVIAGQKGWSKGTIWSVQLVASVNWRGEPYIRFNIGPNEIILNRLAMSNLSWLSEK